MVNKKNSPKYLVLRDSREHEGHGWVFSKRDRCLGTETCALKTGDYTLKGWEERLSIERKGSVSEFATNLFDDRFWRELDRLSLFEHPYLLLEFPFELMESYPKGSGIPPGRWRYLKVRGPLLVKRFHELRLSHPTVRTEFVGGSGKFYCLSLFKRLLDGPPS